MQRMCQIKGKREIIMEIKKDKFNIDWLMEQITVYGKLEKLKTGPPSDGIAKFVWRHIRFHSGIDPSWPVGCYYNLADQIETDNPGVKFSCGILNEFEDNIIKELDKFVISCTNKLNLSHTNAVKVWKGKLF